MQEAQCVLLEVVDGSEKRDGYRRRLKSWPFHFSHAHVLYSPLINGFVNDARQAACPSVSVVLLLVDGIRRTCLVHTLLCQSSDLVVHRV